MATRGIHRYDRNFSSNGGKRNRGPRFGILFFVDCDSGLGVGSWDPFGDGTSERGLWLSCRNCNHNRLPFSPPIHLSYRSDSSSAGPIKQLLPCDQFNPRRHCHQNKRQEKSPFDQGCGRRKSLNTEVRLQRGRPLSRANGCAERASFGAPWDRMELYLPPQPPRLILPLTTIMSMRPKFVRCGKRWLRAPERAFLSNR
jgi:hypothetical protein